ncbi:MAG: hypothetical protein CR968_01765 [Flavobacteriia bacterium]|nr:MAG: hypothetical protein CR968_01765 [Flavobacteriia bacterium]
MFNSNLFRVKIVYYFIIAVVLVGLNACNTNHKKESDVNAYASYLSGIPDSRISVTSDFKFFLNEPVDVTSVSDDVLTIKPRVPGTISLEQNTIIFTPSEKLKSNSTYKLTLHLSKLYNDIDKNLKDFTMTAKTKELLFTVTVDAPMSYDKNWNYVNGFINASDVLETDKLSQILTVTYGGKKQPVTFDDMGALASRIHFKIDSIKRLDDDKELLVQWDGKPVQSTSEGGDEILIIGKKTFAIMDISVIEGDKQQIDISFSDPLKPDQNLKGLIQFAGEEEHSYTYKISNNVVSIYPKSTIKDKIEIEIFKGIKNVDGITMKEDVLHELYFESLKPEVSFISSGSILPNSSNLKINFKAVNLKAVDATVYKIYKNNILQFLQQNDLNNQGKIRYVGRPVAKYTVNLTNRGLELDKPNAFAIDLADLVRVEEGAMYRVKLSINKAYANYSCEDEESDQTITYGKKDIDTGEYDTEGSDYDDYYDYYWEESDDPCTDSYYAERTISTNILATNLGVIVKKGNNNTTFVAVTDLLTTKPVQGVKVELYNLQRQPLISAKTNAEGIAEFNDHENAFFAVASDGVNTTYVKMNDGKALSMSKFDVSGEKLQKGIQGYIYGERGVWRPGDTMYLTFVLNDKNNPLPDKHPVKFELYNPQGKLIDRATRLKNTDNVYTYAPTTGQDALTGNWKLRVVVGGASFNKVLKVETIKPNRLKIKVNTRGKIAKANQNIRGDIEVKWLHGAIAKDLKLDVNAKFYPTKTVFDGFNQYNFDDVTRAFGAEEFKVLEGHLDNQGETSFSIKPKLDSRAPGMLQASFITKVYENAGDFSTDVFTQKVSPYTSYVGLNPAEEQQSSNYLFTDEDYTFNVVSVNEDGKGIANKLEVDVYKLSWRWWWNNSEDGLYSYDGREYHETYESIPVNTGASGKGSFKLNIDKSDWGRYLIKVKDRSSGHTTSSVVYFDWPSWYGKKRSNQDKSNATMLVFTTDKEVYNVNDKIEVKFPSSKGSRALITIENGTEVLDYFWVETKDKQTTFSCPVPAYYAPNVFVNISLIQPHSQTVNDLPIRMYGSVPVSVKNPATQLEPQLTMSDEVRPETKIDIKVKEKNGKPMTYTIALVDEGLLDLTRFKTPNAWNTFYAKQSLGVKTWDIFDDVIGAYGGRINQILSIGGDESGLANKNKKANRFKPMVKFIGPFQLKANGTAKHQIEIPQYVGAVRAMVVASNTKKGAYGSAEKSVFVRKPVMILASLPRKITPQETVTLPVTVFAMTPKVKKVKVSLEPNKSYTIVGDKTQSISFSQPDEKMLYFKLKVNDFKGIGHIALQATSGREKASYKVEIDVLNPNPVTVETHDLIVKSNDNGRIDFSSFGTKGTNKATLELSTLPPINFTKRLQYLIQYPHGCVEQTTSSAFPQLYFQEIFDLPAERRQKIERNIKATIKRLYGFQKSSGGLSYWQGNSYEDDWGTSYAGHFMIEAEKKGYALPVGFKDKWISYQKQAARQWRYTSSSYSGNDLAQAYRLYTLSLANSPDLASMNRLRETKGISNEAKMRLASAYAMIGKRSIALAVLKTLKREQSRYYKHYYGSEIRDKAMGLETYILLDDETKAIKLAQTIAEKLSSDQWMSTQTTAYALLAMSKYALKNGNDTGIEVSYDFNGSKKSITTPKALWTTSWDEVRQNNTLQITNKNKGVVYVRIFNAGVLPVGQEKVIQKNLEANVKYMTKDGEPINIGQLTQGTNFVAEIHVKNTSDDKVENVALTQYLPSGWEIVNTRFTDYGDSTETAEVDYTDIRDARISYYFSLGKREAKTFRVLLNASYQGDYYLPGVQCEAMYDHDYLVRTKGQWIEIVK